jgi:nucleoside-diphosphate-sugar epimerase
LFYQLRAILGAEDVDPAFTEARAGDVRDSQADSSLAKKQLDWEPFVSFEEGLAKTVEWFSGDNQI